METGFIRITDISALELDVYARLSEAELSHIYEPGTGLFVAESPKVIGRALDAGYMPVSLLVQDGPMNGETRSILERCRSLSGAGSPGAASGAGRLPVYMADEQVLYGITGFKLTRGLLCAMRRRPLPEPEALLEGARRVCVLEHVMNPTNVGAIFRSAAALGIDAVLLTADCSDPLYRRSARVSMGTVFQVPWTMLPPRPGYWPEEGLAVLRGHGFASAAMALSDDSVAIDDPAVMAEEKLAIVLGTEGDGLAARTIADCDYTIRIPMMRGVDSLNVAAASAVAFWQLGRQE